MPSPTRKSAAPATETLRSFQKRLPLFGEPFYLKASHNRPAWAASRCARPSALGRILMQPLRGVALGLGCRCPFGAWKPHGIADCQMSISDWKPSGCRFCDRRVSSSVKRLTPKKAPKVERLEFEVWRLEFREEVSCEGDRQGAPDKWSAVWRRPLLICSLIQMRHLKFGNRHFHHLLP